MKDASIGRIDFLFQNIYGPADIFVLFYVTVNLFDTMHDRGMVSLPERFSDGSMGKIRHIPAQIHGVVSWLNDLGVAL